ncbi:MAG: hypothetical protein ACK521_04540 [bacterium]
MIDNFEKRELALRTVLWKAAGYHTEDNTTRHFVKQATVKGKKFALVMLYKVWSAFSKGLRYYFVNKQLAVNLPKVGVFFNNTTPDDDVQTIFCASKELQKVLGFEEEQIKLKMADSLNSKLSTLNWHHIAKAAEVNSAEMVELLVYQIFQQSCHMAHST